MLAGATFYDGSEGETQLEPKVKEFLDAGEPPIIFTLGSAAVMTPGNFYSACIEAVKMLKRRAIVLIGKNAPPKNPSADILAVNYVLYSADS